MRAALSLACALAAAVSGAGARAAPSMTSMPLFEAYKGYPPCFRQPVLVPLGVGSGAVLALAEGRNNSYCSGTNDGTHSTIVARRSADGGRTWSALAFVYTLRSIDFYSAVYDEARAQLHLMLQVNGSLTVHLTSADGGASWSAPATIAFPTGAFASAISGVGHGLQLRGDLCSEATCGGAAGRLLIPFICKTKADRAGVRPATTRDIACAGCYTCLLASDDGGASWRIAAASTQDGTREAGAVQLASAAYGVAGAAVVYASERNMGATTGFRQHALSLDSAASIASVGDDAGIPCGSDANWTGIVAGVARWRGAPAGGAAVVAITTPASPTSRNDLALYTSTDEARTWSAGTVLVPGPAGYSDAAELNATHIAVLYENGPQEFSQQISFGVIDMTAL